MTDEFMTGDAATRAAAGFPPWSTDAAADVLAPYGDEHEVLIALQALQEHFGHVPDAAVPMVASACNVSRADVHGVRTFYRDLRSTPPAPHVVRICMGEACQSVGARALVAGARALAADDPDLDLETGMVFCLGNCALGPSATVNGRLLGRATVESLRALLPDPQPPMGAP